MERIDPQVMMKLLFLASIAFTLLSALYALNAWAGRKADAHNERLRHLAYVSNTGYLLTGIVLFTLSTLGVFYLQHPVIIPYMMGVTILGAIYSFPRLKLKERPFVGTVVHFFFLIIAFNGAASIFRTPSVDSLLISTYFGLLFAGGHLHHEVIDFEADNKAGIRSGVIAIGVDKGVSLSFTLFSMAFALWCVLYATGRLSWVEFGAFAVAYALQSVLFFLLSRSYNELVKRRIWYRSGYRSAYFLAGLVVIVSKL